MKHLTMKEIYSVFNSTLKENDYIEFFDHINECKMCSSLYFALIREEQASNLDIEEEFECKFETLIYNFLYFNNINLENKINLFQHFLNCYYCKGFFNFISSSDKKIKNNFSYKLLLSLVTIKDKINNLKEKEFNLKLQYFKETEFAFANEKSKVIKTEGVLSNNQKFYIDYGEKTTRIYFNGNVKNLKITVQTENETIVNFNETYNKLPSLKFPSDCIATVFIETSDKKDQLSDCFLIMPYEILKG